MYKSEFRYLSSKQNTPFFLAHYSPDSGTSAKAVILVPPFAEELNRSKRMYVLCARQLAAAGLHVACFDFTGTGDSYGAWESVSWPSWLENLSEVYHYLEDAGVSDISVIALRLAALIVADSVTSHQLEFTKCLFWDAIEDGEGYIRQLIRLKIAAAMTEDSKALTSKDVLAELDDHGFLEIGGYHITAQLFDSIKQAKLKNSIETLVDATELHWMVLRSANQSISTPSYPLCLPENLRHRVSMHTVLDTRFWMQQEVTIAPALLQKTGELFVHAD